jgi:hypothetical protein
VLVLFFSSNIYLIICEFASRQKGFWTKKLIVLWSKLFGPDKKHIVQVSLGPKSYDIKFKTDEEKLVIKPVFRSLAPFSVRKQCAFLAQTRFLKISSF